MFAVIKTGGKQYKVQVGETIDVEKLNVEEGEPIRLDQVLLAANDGDVAYGRPLIEGAVVTARVVRQHKGPKLIVFRYKSKSRYRRRTGHRQKLTQLAIQTIEIPGWETAMAAPPSAASRAATTTAPEIAAPEATATASEAEATATVSEMDAAMPATAAVAETRMAVPESDAVDTITPQDEAQEARAAAPTAPGSAAPAHDVLPATTPMAQVDAADDGTIEPVAGAPLEGLAPGVPLGEPHEQLPGQENE